MMSCCKDKGPKMKKS